MVSRMIIILSPTNLARLAIRKDPFTIVALTELGNPLVETDGTCR